MPCIALTLWWPIIVPGGRGFWSGGTTVYIYRGGNWDHGWRSRTNILIWSTSDGGAPSSTGLYLALASPPVVASSSHIDGDEEGMDSIASTEVGGMVNIPSSHLQLQSVPALGGSPLKERETTMFDDWPLELGPHLIDAEARKVRAFIRSYHRCFYLAFKILKVIKENPSTFSWRLTIAFFGNLIGLVFLSGLPFRLVSESFWQQESKGMATDKLKWGASLKTTLRASTLNIRLETNTNIYMTITNTKIWMKINLESKAKWRIAGEEQCKGATTSSILHQNQDEHHILMHKYRGKWANNKALDVAANVIKGD